MNIPGSINQPVSPPDTIPAMIQLPVREKDPGQVCDSVDLTASHPESIKTYITGNEADAAPPTRPGICLMGGGAEVDSAMKWMIEKSGGGDFVVLRADDSDGYNDYLYKELGGVDSVQTLVIDSREKADSPYVEQVLKNAEAVFIAGGSQWEYYKYWNGTRVEDALQYLAEEKKIPIGGTSAGCHSLGGIVYSAENGGVTSAEATADPHNEMMTFRSDFLAMPGMKHIITDTHFKQRDRMGRSVAFLARNVENSAEPEKLKVLSVDTRTAVTIDGDGNANVWGSGKGEDAGSVFILQANGGPQNCTPGSPLTFEGDRVHCTRIQGTPAGEGGFRLGSDGSVTGVTGGEEYAINMKDGTFLKDPYHKG